MAHPGKIEHPVYVYDPMPSREAIDGLGATNNRPVGSQTLVAQRQQAQPAPSAIEPTRSAGPGADAAEEEAPKESTVRWFIKKFVTAAVVPAINHIGTEWLVELVPEDYRGIVRPVAHMINAVVAKPALDWMSKRLIDALADPVTFKDSVKAVVKLVANEPSAALASVRGALPKEMPGKGSIGRAARQAIVNASDGALHAVLLNLAARASGHPQLASTLQTVAPYIAQMFGKGLDLALAIKCPLTEVAPEDVPAVGDPLNVCSIWQATVTKVAGNYTGTYNASVAFQSSSAHPWVSLAGTAILTTGLERRIVGVSKLADATLVIGVANKYTLTKLETSAYSEHTGWSLSAGKMTPEGSDDVTTLEHLTISPIGWIDGAFMRAGRPGALGGTAPDGVRWPPTPAPVTAASDQASAAIPAATNLPAADGSTLGGGIHNAIVGRHNAWISGYPLLAFGWWTQYANLMGKKDRRPEEVLALREAHPTSTWLERLDPTGLIAELSAVDLVPSFLRTGYPKVSFDPYELKVGPEPSLTFKMSTTMQLFKDIDAFSASQVTIAWLPWATPSVVMRTGSLAFGDALEVSGLELDPAGGVRTPNAKVKVPLPTETFSMANLVVEAEYLRVGHEIDFRSAKMAANEISIGNVVTVKKAEVGIEPGKNPRLTATIVDADAVVDGVTALTFSGTASWGGGRAATGNGKVVATKLRTPDGMITATGLSGSLDVKAGAVTAEINATELVLAYEDYTLKTDAKLAVDRYGLAKLDIPRLTVWKAGVQVGAASNVVYERNKTLTIGTLALDLPETGPLRGTKDAASGPKPQLATTDLDLSSRVRKPGSAEAPAPDASKKKAPGLAVTNLARLELGPSGTPLLALDFTDAARRKVDAEARAPAEGALSAVVSGQLGQFKLTPTIVDVERSTANASDVRVTLTKIAGTGYHIKSAIYDDGKLTVTEADIQVDKLLDAAVPEVLSGLASSVATTFVIDTRNGRLLELAMTGKLGGKLFGGRVTITDGVANLKASPGPLTAGAIASGLGISGDIRGTVTAAAYEMDAVLKGSIAIPSGAATLSGRATSPGLTLEVNGASFHDGKTTFESASATFARPENDLVKFLPWKSKIKLSEEDRATVKIIIAKNIELEGGAQSEQLSEAPVAASSADAPLAVGVHLPEINIHDGAFVLRADDVIVPKHEDMTTVTLSGQADLDLGLLRGRLGGSVTMAIPAGKSMPKASSIVLAVDGEKTLGGLTMSNIRYENGKLTAGAAKMKTPTLLGGFPAPLGLDKVEWAATDLEIDVPRKAVKVGTLGATVGELSCLGGGLRIARASAELTTSSPALDGASLIPSGWGLELTADGARIGTESLSIEGSARLGINPSGLASGELINTTFRYGVGEASVGKIALTPDGWDATDVRFVVGKTTAVGFDLIPSLPSWLSAGPDYQVQATFPLTYRNKQVVWPSLSQIQIDVLKAGLALPGVTGSFDRTKGKRTASIAVTPKTGSFSVGMQFPLAHGVGIEIGGSLDHAVSLEARDVELAAGDDLAFAGTVAGKASLKGRVRVGVFGGVPALFTVSAGIYAGIDLDANLTADASGTWKLPRKGGTGSTGAVQLYFRMTDTSGNPTKLTGEVGAYAAVRVLGYGKTIEKPFSKTEIATLVAHGFAKLDTETGVTLLPTGEFPTHRLRLNPKLDELLTGGDTQKAISIAYQTVDRGARKQEAVQELLDEQPTTKEQRNEIAAEKAAAATHVKEVHKAIEKSKDGMKLEQKCLDAARVKLTDHKAKLANLAAGGTTSGRAVLNKPLEERLIDYATHQGLVDKPSELTAEQLKLKIVYKEEEITHFEACIAAKDRQHSELRAEEVAAINAEHFATKQAEFAGKSKGAVQIELDRRQRRLIQMYGTLQSAHKKVIDHAARNARKAVKLEADKKTAQQRIEVLNTDPDASKTEKQFWTAQLAFITDELAALEVETAPAPIEMSPKTTATFKRAKEKQKDAVATLSDKIDAQLQLYQAKIEAKTLELGENFTKLSKIKVNDATAKERTKLEKKRDVLLGELEELQKQIMHTLEDAEALE